MSVLWWSLAVALGSGGLLGVGIVVYAFGSFFVMRSKNEARKLGMTSRELFREIALAALTQPFLPFYYVFGRRMSHRKGGIPVVFVHGYFQNRVCFVGLARRLRDRVGPIFALNYPWYSTVPANALRLEGFVDDVLRETGASAVDLVCHSMGGLVAIEMLRDDARKAERKVRRCVTIATPHAGVAWRGPMIGRGSGSLRAGSELLALHAKAKLSVPFLSIFSTHDNIVFPKATSALAARGGRDVEVEGLAHLAILFSPVVAEHVAGFLLEADAKPV